MRILALETSSTLGSIAILEDRRLVKTVELGRVQRTAQSLAPALDTILREVAWTPRDIELIAVTDGPGSFTGLRTGVTTAKVFAYATGAKVIAINTLEVIAAQADFERADVQTSRLWSVMDAQRQQSFIARYDAASDGSVSEIRATEIVDNDTWLQQLEAGDHVTGTGLANLVDRLPAGIRIVAEDAWLPQAAMLGQLALAKHKLGERNDLWKLAPQYFRKSAAEETFEQGLLK